MFYGARIFSAGLPVLAFPLFSLWAVLPGALQADTLLLKNGDRLSGQMRIDVGRLICIDTPHGDYEVRLDLVQHGAFQPPRNLRLHLPDRTLIIRPLSFGPGGLAFDPEKIIGERPDRFPNPIPWTGFLALTEL